MNFKKALEERTEYANSVINKYLLKEEGYQKKVIEAVNYSILAGGKRLRPILMKETFDIFNGKGEVVEPFMAAIEMIHTYSLVHDDLPAMDNDKYRRGKKTTWLVYGEDMGILAGDALLNLSVETALKAFDIDFENKNLSKALKILLNKSGIYGMLGGQVLDVELTGKKIDNKQLDFIFRLKTAAMIESSMMIGAVLAGADDNTVSQIEKIGNKVGVAFQIRDDILDVTGDEIELGKPVKSDEKNNKSTYVTLYGIEQSQKDVDRLSSEAIDIMKSLNIEDEFLTSLILKLVGRNK
ncbi:geranylgeranyl diphosphate synthase, type II [Acetitomaculum ruminis DSM 5522]|uniref:Farnesyl diphosphate synthase n=1 Tax=Acetitomaculum ruminis DSM 5522 TaxID=1120918 RepID=A0A1I0VU53_9FIRM|nr:farnesyl diphosphate synthase [Acetitomaculum ruminis]SFA79483.1 geranylgeranyl diphosphate synthase, type II [Acetitomaculum ruminis DSM 5522]